MATNQYTFWKLINECRIEIPTIQRDYTYGRKNAKDISEKLIGSILEALLLEEHVLHLDFIYGKRLGIETYLAIEKNKSSIDTLLQTISSYAENLNLEIEYKTNPKSTQIAEIVTFIPLDGQQRLTTLFLIHWYIANLVNDNVVKYILNRFNYATRISSRDFLRMICDSNHHFDLELNGSISDSIENHESFYLNWKKDPTVLSMLSVLDEIQRQFNQRKLIPKSCLENLLSKSKVTFDFFDLDEFELTDELYLKMNARGKKLTIFENFKAWLIKNNSDHISVQDWKKKLDIGWNDIFWNEKEVGQTQIDSSYLQYFKNMFLGDYLLQEKNSENEKDETIDLLRLDSEFNPIKVFQKNQLFSQKISDYLYLLDIFKTKNLPQKLNPNYFDQKTRSLSKLLFQNNNSLTWWHTTFYFAVTRYIIQTNGDVRYLNQWVRVVSNLIYNTPIESPKLFKEACQSIQKLIQRIGDQNVYEIFANLNTDEIDFFVEKQKDEEIKKARLIVDNPALDWENVFASLESHTYFYGQIGFIFKLLKNETFDEFVSVSEKVGLLYSEEIMTDATYLLFRSFLTIKDCFFENGNVLTYPSNLRGTLRNRNENWRRFFENKTAVLIDFIEQNTFTQNNVVDKLNELISNYVDNGTFSAKLIKNTSLLTYPINNHIRRYNKAHYLLSKTRIYSYFIETFTYDWVKSNSDFCILNNIVYKYGKGEDTNPGIIVKEKEERILYYNSDSGKFLINTNPELIFNTIDEAIQKLIN